MYPHEYLTIMHDKMNHAKNGFSYQLTQEQATQWSHKVDDVSGGYDCSRAW